MQTQKASAVRCPMTASSIKSKLKKVLQGIAVLFFWLFIWEIISLWVGNGLIFSSPVSTLASLGALVCDGGFWIICARSLLRMLTGFLFGVLFGTVCAALSVNRVFSALFSPLMSTVRCVPVASFIILTWYFLSRDDVPVFTAFLIVTPVMWVNVRKGIESVGSGLREVAQVYDFSPLKRFQMLYAPAVLPYFSAGLSASLGLAWKSCIAAEVLCRPDKSIGNEIFLSKSYLETPVLFAWTSVVVIFSMILEKALSHFVGGKNDKT